MSGQALLAWLFIQLCTNERRQSRRKSGVSSLAYVDVLSDLGRRRVRASIFARFLATLLPWLLLDRRCLLGCLFNCARMRDDKVDANQVSVRLSMWMCCLTLQGVACGRASLPGPWQLCRPGCSWRLLARRRHGCEGAACDIPCGRECACASVV